MKAFSDRMWDALRDVACHNGRDAESIVLLRKQDLERACRLIEEQAIDAEKNRPLVASEIPTQSVSNDLPLGGEGYD